MKILDRRNCAAGLLAVAATIMLAGCSLLPFQNLTSLTGESGLRYLPPASDYPNSDAIVLLNRTDVALRFLRGRYRTIKIVRYAKLVFRNTADQARVEIPLRVGEPLLGIRAWVIQPTGEKKEVDSRDFFVVSGESGRGGVFYADWQKLEITFPDVRQGSVLEYVYREESYLPFLSDEWDFQGDLPVMRSIYSITAPSSMFDDLPDNGENWKWNVKTYNHTDIGKPSFDQYLSQRGTGYNFEVMFKWTLDSIPAFCPEPDMPPENFFRGYAVFASDDWQRWDDLSRWYYGSIFKPGLLITKDIKDEAGNITKSDSTDLSKINDLLKYVEGIQYGPENDETGGLVPDYTDVVMYNRYGDGFELSNLLIALLRSVGIVANPALTLAGPEARIDTSFVSWQFNREIVRAVTSKGRVLWLDPAVLNVRLGMVPSDDDGATTLVLNDDSTCYFQTIAPSEAWENGIFARMNVVANLDSMSTIKVELRFEGEDELSMRNSFAYATQEDVREYCEGLISNNFETYQFSDCSMTPVDSLGTYFTLSFSFRVPDFIRREGSGFSIYCDPLPVVQDLDWLGSSARKYPVMLDYPRIIQKRIEIRLADSTLSVARLPDEVNLKTPDFQFSSSCVESAPTLLVTQSVLTSNSKEIPINRYKESSEFFYGVSKSEGEVVELLRK